MAAPTPSLVVVLALLLGEFGCRRGPVPRRVGRGDRQDDVARRDLEQAILATDLVVIVQLEPDDDNKVRRKNGLLQIAARNIVLTVSATDASGNRATATAKLAKKQREHDD